jgi:hypothetical protein
MAVLLAACVALASGGAVSAVTEPDPVGQEVRLCLPPDAEGAPISQVLPTVNERFDPDYGCAFATEELPDPFSDRMLAWHSFPDVGLPGLVTGVHIAETDLSRSQLRSVAARPGVTAPSWANRTQRQLLRRLRPGPYTIVMVHHDELGPDVGVNLFTNLDDRPSNDVPLPPGAPDLPLAGNDGGYSMFGGDRLFVTDFRDGRGTYYEGDPGRFPVLASRARRQTSFLIPSDGVGTTVTPFVFADEALHYIDILPNGALPVRGVVPLFPGCLSQEIIHRPLLIGGEPASASTDWLTSCFPVGESITSAIASSIGDRESLQVGVSLFSFDPDVTDRRPQKVYAEVSVGSENLYVRFPSGLLGYGYHRDLGMLFDATEDPVLDAVLGAAASSLDEYLVPVVVDASAGIIQGRDACLEPGDQEQPGIG